VQSVFKLTQDGTLTTLVTVSYRRIPPPFLSALALGRDGNLYAAAPNLGQACDEGCSLWDFGSILKITTNSEVTELTTFYATNGTFPNVLLMGYDGNLYGTTGGGGNGGFGTVFRLTTNGELTTLISFDGTNGGSPNALVLGSDGSLYVGGSSILRVELSGALTSLASLDGLGSGSDFLVFGKDGNLYGTTGDGGSFGGGTFFRLNIPGAGSPKIISTTKSGNTIRFNWLALPGRSYQLQFTTSLTSPKWANSGSPLTATNTTMSVSETFSSDPKRFYRLALLP